MTETHHNRRLAAILVADVVGYSALIRADEEAARAAVRRLNTEVLELQIDAHRGRIFKTVGDGLLAEFASVVDAVRCAVAIQTAIKARNDAEPVEKPLVLRIGVNLGDVIAEGDDLHGDGVNVASRLEGLSEPQGVCISSSAFEQVRDKLGVGFRDLGEKQVKNISRPVRAYQVLIDPKDAGKLQIAPPAGVGRRRRMFLTAALSALVVAVGLVQWQPWTSSGPISEADRAALSIMVLPFANSTGDPGQEYVADGLTSSVISDLNRIRDAHIAAAATSFTYKGKPVNLKQIGADEGVRFILQGGVQRDAEKLRINAQLADTGTGAQLWTETFEGKTTNLFELQDQVTARIGNSLGREMVIFSARENETRVTNPLAADLILRGTAAFMKPQSLELSQQIEGWCREALVMEPSNASAIECLARALVIQAFNFGAKLPPEVKEQKFIESRDLLLKAKEIDPNNPRIYGGLALYYASHNEFPAHRRAAETWLSLDPKNPMAHNFEANVLLFLGDYKKVIKLLDKGVSLDPKHVNVQLALTYTRAYFLSGDDDNAIEWAQRALELNPRFFEGYVFQAMAYARKGDNANAQKAVAEVMRLNPGFKLAKFRAPASTHPDAHKKAYTDILLPAGRKAGLPE